LAERVGLQPVVYFLGFVLPSLGIVFQEIALFPWRSVYENVIFGLEGRGDSKQEQQEKGKHYIEMVGLSGFESAYPKQLSGGMRQRAGIARPAADGKRVMGRLAVFMGLIFIIK